MYPRYLFRPYLDVVKEMFMHQDNSENDTVIMDRKAKRAGAEMVSKIQIVRKIDRKCQTDR